MKLATGVSKLFIVKNLFGLVQKMYFSLALFTSRIDKY
jgi:hypothetical protein